MTNTLRYLISGVLLIIGVSQLWIGLHGPMWIKVLENRIWIQPEYGQTVLRAVAGDISFLRSKLILFILFGVADVILAILIFGLSAKGNRCAGPN